MYGKWHTFSFLQTCHCIQCNDYETTRREVMKRRQRGEEEVVVVAEETGEEVEKLTQSD